MQRGKGRIRILLTVGLIAVSLMIITTSCLQPKSPQTQSPASLSVTNIIITPVVASTNETVTITAEITNSGGTSGSYLAVLRLNDIPKAQTQISVPAQGKQYVSWQIKGGLGSCLVSVGEASASYTVLPSEDSTPVVSTAPSERKSDLPTTESLPMLRGMPFTSDRAITQVYYYLFQISKASKQARDYCDELEFQGEFTADFQYSFVNQDVNGHKHTGWIVSNKLTQPRKKWIYTDEYYKDYWKSLVWLVCKDGYIYEFNPETKKVTEDINLLNSSTAPTYYLFPTPYTLILSVKDEPGDCQSGYIDIVEFETWREDTKYTFILHLADSVVTEKTSYNIFIDSDRAGGPSVSTEQGADYIVSVDYNKNQFGLLEKNEKDEFIKVRNLLKLKVEGNTIEVTVDLKDIALTWPGFEVYTALFTDTGGTPSIDTSPPWWYK
jgi:hypothetical protein